MSQPSYIYANCPNESCRAKNRIKLSRDVLGKEKMLRCGACKTEFLVQIPAKVNDGSKSSPRERSTMEALDEYLTIREFLTRGRGLFH
jgi:hypothetical protein